MDLLDFSAYDVPATLPARDQRPPTENEQDNFDDLGENDFDNLGVDESATTGATRRPRAKMDSARILGDKGLPALQKTMLRFKFKGKGHEKRDLTKLLGTYQLWGHKLYPKANFDDFLILCRRGGRDSAIKVYRRKVIDEEKYGSLASKVAAEAPGDAAAEGQANVASLLDMLDDDEPELPGSHEEQNPEPSDDYDVPERESHEDEGDDDAYAAAMEAYQDIGF